MLESGDTGFDKEIEYESNVSQQPIKNAGAVGVSGYSDKNSVDDQIQRHIAQNSDARRSRWQLQHELMMRIGTKS